MIHNLHRLSVITVLLGCLGGQALLVGCSGQPGGDGSEADSEHTGSIGLALQLAPGLTLSQVSYTIVGPLAFAKSGVIDVSNSVKVSAVIAGLPAGDGYSVTLSGTSTDGSTTCAGSASFKVIAHQTTVASLGLSCHQAASNGSVQINGAINICPVLDGISATPAQIAVGGSIALAAVARDSDSGPAPLAYSWAATSGTLSDPSAAAPTFTCTTPGVATLSVGVSDGDLASGCADTATVTVTCTATVAQVQAILDANCTSCHSGATPPRGLSLVDIKTVVGAPAAECTQKLRITSGDATHSYLVDKIMGAAQDGGCFTGRQMPAGKPALAASDIATIANWINAGTP